MDEIRRDRINDTAVRPAESTQVNTDFMKEQIKARPINRRKLVRRTLVTAFLAVVFGAVACAVFLLLEPVINAAIDPVEESKPVSFPEEMEEVEIDPEEMFASDTDITQARVEEQVSQIKTDEIKKEVLSEVVNSRDIINELRVQYDALSSLAHTAMESMVVIEGISVDYDWAGDVYNSHGSGSGVIIADTGSEYLILADSAKLKDVRQIRVTMNDGSKCSARIRAEDTVTGLSVLEVSKEELSGEKNESIVPVFLGSSARSDLLGKPVIAVGSPSGTAGSVSYGIVTNAAQGLDIIDSTFKQITTDIYGSTQASGILIDISGRMIGWIDVRYNSSDSQNLISAIGVSEIKSIIERMSNRERTAFLGVHGTDVTGEAHDELHVPGGAYVLRTEMDSPAMEAGIQSGDVIVEFNGKAVISYRDLLGELNEMTPGRIVRITVMRRGVEEYEEIALRAILTDRLIIPGE